MMCRCPSMKPGMTVIPRASICRTPGGAALPAPTEAIRPLRTTSVPESMTDPLPTMMRAFEMTRSCAPARNGSASDGSIITARTNSLFMARGYAVRFCFVYFALWCAATQVLGGLLLTPFGGMPALGPLWPMRHVTEWIGTHLFGVDARFAAGNSGDTFFYWVQTFWILCISAIVAAIWTLVERRDRSTLPGWFRIFIRFALAAQMFYFGMAKIIPTQFLPPALTTLVQPTGNMPLSTLLWVFMGASLPYQAFTGVAELAAGLLLISPRTTPLGALIALADMIQVFVLNMAYDVGLKQLSFHFIVMALLVLAPDMRRLAAAIVRTDERPHAAQIAVGVYLLATFTLLQIPRWGAPDGPAHPPSPLYGIWNIDQLTIDGQLRPAVLNDYDRRWRRAIFDFPDRMAFERTDDSLARYGVSIDTGGRLLSLSKGNSQTWRAEFSYQRPSGDELILDGMMDGHSIRMHLSLVGLDTFPLLNSRFRWVRPPD